ncbi:cobyric acid synthase [Motilimonas eburnea]|uniref:cobyric acid synthase n=1 Tax=Motilimonas eburnea TaxID=1737488 RepID=UPI001E52D4BE|nr:cobyric acid synthase [Motilimonas eburnea]MCE2572524.1 cobyric acid synthase [Motilimonas eburnea]
MAKPMMMMGCTSDAGKSLLVAAACRVLANRGMKVAPFKAQNMSNNAAVTPDGLEIGRAQYLQALAARAVPDVRMNPVLLKPSAETFSQVIVNGVADKAISAMPWMDRKSVLWQHVTRALSSLQADYEQLVIEGAGSPAEINLRAGDIVNMAVALETQADVYLISDIDRGGSFAHLLGTWACLAEEEQRLIKGFVLNKFRGDPKLLGNAMDWLEAKTGIPTVANIPMYDHRLPEEDAFRGQDTYVKGELNIALLIYPYAANMDEFDPLFHQVGVNVSVIREPQDLSRYDAVVLPGSKNSGASMAYLVKTGLAQSIIMAAKSGKLVLGICGGLQILGEQLLDPNHLEAGDFAGLGLLPLTTELAAIKATSQVHFEWQGQRISGYEIHHGQTKQHGAVSDFLQPNLGWQRDNVVGIYLHGAFDNAAFMAWFVNQLGQDLPTQDWHQVIDVELEKLATQFERDGWL